MIKKRIIKWKKQIFCIFAGFFLCFLAAYNEKRDLLSRGYVERNGYGESVRTYELMVEGLDEEPVPCAVEIEPLQYSEEEAQAVFDRLFMELPSLILGENPALDQVRTDLNLITLFEGTGMRALWQSRDPRVLDSYGRIGEDEIPPEGLAAELEVILTDGIRSREGCLDIRILPHVRSRQEELAAEFKEKVRQADLSVPCDRQVLLPSEYRGSALQYRRAGGRDYLFLPLLGILAAVMLRGQEKAEKERLQKKRKQLLQLDYADIVYQLMVYTGAGLTAARSWEQIVSNYEKNRKTGAPRPAYEEMALSLNQIRCGMPEGEAISEFGRRCKLQSYMKLGSLLEQNRKTGTKNLNQLLEQEMMSAWEEQKHTARRMGEEARTRLLAPLFLMLLVVMVIIMVPAMTAMSN